MHCAAIAIGAAWVSAALLVRCALSSNRVLMRSIGSTMLRHCRGQLAQVSHARTCRSMSRGECIANPLSLLLRAVEADDVEAARSLPSAGHQVVLGCVDHPSLFVRVDAGQGAAEP